MQQHAKPLDCSQSARTSGLHEWRPQRNIDDVGHDRLATQRAEINLQRRLAFHAERACVDQQIRLRQFSAEGAPRGRDSGPAELRGERDGSGRRPVDDGDAAEASRRQRLNDRPSGAPGPNDDSR